MLPQWILILVAGLFEIAWAISMKYTEGYTRLKPSVLNLCAMFLSIYFLSRSLKYLPIGTAYALWTGIGAVGTAILGILIFGESREPARIVCILLVIAGIVGLQWTSSH
jgi:quaternary ammonium compound-resistance protein SugE